jgi:hypothetical protein
VSAEYGLVGRHTNDWLTYGGQVLVHNDRDEMRFLFPDTRVERITSDPGPTLPLRLHPDLATVVWPLDPRDFR